MPIFTAPFNKVLKTLLMPSSDQGSSCASVNNTQSLDPCQTSCANFSASDIRIAMVGQTGAGKTSFANRLVGMDGTGVGHSLMSCTTDITTFRYQSDSYSVVLIDTPGFNDTTMTDYEVLRRITDWLCSTYQSGKLSGVLYFHRISDIHMTGTERRNIDVFRALVGNEALMNVIIVSTMWDLFITEVGVDMEAKLVNGYWKEMVDKKARVVRHYNDTASARSIVGMLLEMGGLPRFATRVTDLVFKQNSNIASLEQSLVVDEFGQVKKVRTCETGQLCNSASGVRDAFSPSLLESLESGLPTSSVVTGLTSISRASSIYSITRRDITNYTMNILQYVIEVDSVVHLPGFSSLLELAVSVIEPMQNYWPEERSLGYPCLHLSWFVLAVQNYTKYGCSQETINDVLPFIPSFACTFQPLQDILVQEEKSQPLGRLNHRSAAIDVIDEQIRLVCLALATKIGSDVFTLHLSLFHEDFAIQAMYWRVSETLQPVLPQTTDGAQNEAHRGTEATTEIPQRPQLSRDEQFEMLVQRVATLEQELAVFRNTPPRFLIMGGTVTIINTVTATEPAHHSAPMQSDVAGDDVSEGEAPQDEDWD